MLILEEELNSAARDRKGNFEAQHTRRRWDASLYRPEVDEVLAESAAQFKKQIEWPEGKVFAACLTHDVDVARLGGHSELLRKMMLQISAEKRLTKKLSRLSGLFGLRHSPLKTDIFTPWVTEEKKYGFSSSFFVSVFPGESVHHFDNTYKWNDRSWYRGEKSPFLVVVRDLAALGCDIGLHGSYASAKDGTLLTRQKEALEKAVGQEIMSSRQHNLHFDACYTPKALERAGIRVD